MKTTYKVIATHDLFGWYPKIYRRTKKGGWKLESVGEYHETRDECLMSVNIENCIYEYID